jgi:hypothetical protein
LSLLVFVTYLVSRPVGLVCAAAIAIGSIISTCAYSLQSGASPAVFLFPLIQLIASLALYGDATMQKKITQRLVTGS